MILKELPIIFLDIQTTGASPKNANILEIAWAYTAFNLTANTNLTRKESYLLEQSDQKIPKHIRVLTGIKNTDLEDALTKEDVVLKLKEFLVATKLKAKSDKIFAVIHYAKFEIPFLKDLLNTEDLPFQIICTHEISKKLFPNLPTRGIKGLAGYYGDMVEDFKRASHHVEATKTIWQGVITSLAEHKIQNLEELQAWLNSDTKVKRTKYEYPFERQKRLNVTVNPGIYRMLNKKGEILYIGKATSLKSRVNSYFRGQKNRDAKKLELLTQVWDIDVTSCKSPLEAALLETDEIKKYNPKYNVSLKAENRRMAFYNYDFTSVSLTQDEIHYVGPFSSIFVLDSMLKLSQSLVLNSSSLQLSAYVFFDPIDENILGKGFQLFCKNEDLDSFQFKNIRKILAQGMKWIRKENKQEEIEVDVALQEVSAVESNIEEELTADEIAKKFKRHFIRAAASYLRARKLTKLLNSNINFKITDQECNLIMRNGMIINTSDQDKQKDIAVTSNRINRIPWQNMSIDTYDRMSVLSSELLKLKKQHQFVDIYYI